MDLNYIKTFEIQIDQISEILSPESSIEETTKENLFQSVYVEVRNKLFTKLSELETSEISLIPVPKSNEEMGDFSQKMAETMTRIGFNFEDEFVLSCKSVLDDFVAKLSSTLSQDQVAKLKDIVSV